MKVSQSGKCEELWKFLQVQSQKPSSAMMKPALMRTGTGKEDPKLLLLQEISSLELPASEIAAQINASQSSTNRHISTSTVQRRLCESGLHGWIAAKKPILKDTNKKILSWAKKRRQWTLDQWKLVQMCDFWFQPLCLFQTQSRWTDDLHRCGSHCKAWRKRRCDGEGVLCWWHCVWFI